MSEAVAVGAHVLLGLGVHAWVEGDPFGDGEAESFKAGVLGRVVGEQTEVGDPEFGEDLGTDAVLATVDGEAVGENASRWLTIAQAFAGLPGNEPRRLADR